MSSRRDPDAHTWCTTRQLHLHGFLLLSFKYFLFDLTTHFVPFFTFFLIFLFFSFLTFKKLFFFKKKKNFFSVLYFFLFFLLFFAFFKLYFFFKKFFTFFLYSFTSLLLYFLTFCFWFFIFFLVYFLPLFFEKFFVLFFFSFLLFYLSHLYSFTSFFKPFFKLFLFFVFFWLPLLFTFFFFTFSLFTFYYFFHFSSLFFDFFFKKFFTYLLFTFSFFDLFFLLFFLLFYFSFFKTFLTFLLISFLGFLILYMFYILFLNFVDLLMLPSGTLGENRLFCEDAKVAAQFSHMRDRLRSAMILTPWRVLTWFCALRTNARRRWGRQPKNWPVNGRAATAETTPRGRDSPRDQLQPKDCLVVACFFVFRDGLWRDMWSPGIAPPLSPAKQTQTQEPRKVLRKRMWRAAHWVEDRTVWITTAPTSTLKVSEESLCWVNRPFLMAFASNTRDKHALRLPANVIWHHCVSANATHLLRLHRLHCTDLADVIDAKVSQTCARFSDVMEDECRAPHTHRTSDLWRQGLQTSSLGVGSHTHTWQAGHSAWDASPQVTNWQEANVSSEQVVRFAAMTLSAENGNGCPGTCGQDVGASSYRKGGDSETRGSLMREMAEPGKWTPQADDLLRFREKPESWSSSVGQGDTETDKDNNERPLLRTSHTRACFVLPLTGPSSTCEVYFEHQQVRRLKGGVRPSRFRV